MVITNLGEGCFRLQSGETSLLLDPVGNRFKADLILRTVYSASTDAETTDQPTDVISFPGEYEIKGIEVEGYSLSEESDAKTVKTIYAVNWEDMKFVFLGQVSHVPNADIMEKIGDPDVMVIPVSADKFFKPSEVAKIIKQIEPKIIIPNLYGENDLKSLSKELDQPAAKEDKFVFKKKDLPLEQVKLVVL